MAREVKSPPWGHTTKKMAEIYTCLQSQSLNHSVGLSLGNEKKWSWKSRSHEQRCYGMVSGWDEKGRRSKAFPVNGEKSKNRGSWYLKAWRVAGTLFISYLRIRKGTRQGQLEGQEKQREPNGLCEKFPPQSNCWKRKSTPKLDAFAVEFFKTVAQTLSTKGWIMPAHCFSEDECGVVAIVTNWGYLSCLKDCLKVGVDTEMLAGVARPSDFSL